MEDLEPIDPTEAVELYLDYRRREVADATLKSHKSRLSHFVDWCEENEIENLNQLTGRKIHEFRVWRTNCDGGSSPVTEKGQMDTLRVFIRFVDSIDGVRKDLSEQVQSPTLPDKSDARDVMLAEDRAEQILSHLETYRYASRPHVVLALMWDSSMRRGAIRALDVDDYHPDHQYIEVRHRPETNTPLKNKENGERMVALRSYVCSILDD
jgi:site-specific recombinase XerD